MCEKTMRQFATYAKTWDTKKEDPECPSFKGEDRENPFADDAEDRDGNGSESSENEDDAKSESGETK